MFSLSTRPSIDIIIGPMYSGKSSELIRRLNIYSDMGMKVIFINSSLDNRDTTRLFSTHNKTIGEVEIPVIKLSRLSNFIHTEYDVIGIDEAQFFNDLKDSVLNMVENFNKIVLIAGLNGDFRRQPFGHIIDLISYSDTVTKLHPFCSMCKENDSIIVPAQFTKRIDKTDLNTILIGNRYIPVCRNCYKKF